YSLQAECADSLDRLGNDLLHSSRQMETSHYAVKRLTREGIPGMSQHIHDTGMGARSEHEDTLVLQSHGDESLINDQAIRLPTRTILGAPIVPLTKKRSSRMSCAFGVEHACSWLFERGRTRNIVNQCIDPSGVRVARLLYIPGCMYVGTSRPPL